MGWLMASSVTSPLLILTESICNNRSVKMRGHGAWLTWTDGRMGDGRAAGQGGRRRAQTGCGPE